jgi:glycosyltransferase involved in cell wall biosynthesis
MGKKYDRALLLCPEKYSLYNSFHEMLSVISEDVTGFDITSAIDRTELKINSQSFRLPFSIRKRWEAHFLRKANRMLLEVVNKITPDLVLVYNSVYLLPETCSLISKRAKLVFFMGDSPFYTPQNNYYLSCLPYADLILSPDSFWSKQLNTTGLNKTLYFIPSPDSKSYFRIGDINKDKNENETEILYVGSSYLNSWGYKKALLMSKFTDLKFEIHGNSAWKRWFAFFPELEAVYHESGFIRQETLNRMFNLTKIIPVDGNPGIVNGVHLRLFEALSAGALPLIEYRNDVDNLLFRDFKGDLPVINDYGRAADLAAYYLRNDQERTETVIAMREYIDKEYSASKNALRLMDALH